MGIYEIINRVNNKKYIGSSANIIARWGNHISLLNNNSHHSYKLQEDWNTYGINNFSFCIIHITSNKNHLLSLEQEYLDNEPSFSNLYNINDYTNYKSISISTEFLKRADYVNQLECDTIHKLKKNIIIFEENRSMKEIGKGRFDLSKTWFIKNQDKISQLSNNILNYFTNYLNGKSKEIAWTTFMDNMNKVSNRGNKRSFVPMSGEINIDDRRNILCFAANCFPNSFIKQATIKQNIMINDDEYALSIILKWIINVSNIDNDIHIYIPSSRMKKILKEWIGNKTK